MDGSSVADPVEGCRAAARGLICSAKAHSAQLLADVDSPHEELMSLVWGFVFDRDHALRLLAGRPANAAAVLPEIITAAERFDGLSLDAKRRMRSLILRHEQQAKMREV